MVARQRNKCKQRRHPVWPDKHLRHCGKTTGSSRISRLPASHLLLCVQQCDNWPTSGTKQSQCNSSNAADVSQWQHAAATSLKFLLNKAVLLRKFSNSWHDTFDKSLHKDCIKTHQIQEPMPLITYFLRTFMAHFYFWPGNPNPKFSLCTIFLTRLHQAD